MSSRENYELSDTIDSVIMLNLSLRGATMQARPAPAGSRHRRVRVEPRRKRSSSIRRSTVHRGAPGSICARGTTSAPASRSSWSLRARCVAPRHRTPTAPWNTARKPTSIAIGETLRYSSLQARYGEPRSDATGAENRRRCRSYVLARTRNIRFLRLVGSTISRLTA